MLVSSLIPLVSRSSSARAPRVLVLLDCHLVLPEVPWRRLLVCWSSSLVIWCSPGFLGESSSCVGPPRWSIWFLGVPRRGLLVCWSSSLVPLVSRSSSARAPRVLVLLASPPGFREVPRRRFSRVGPHLWSPCFLGYSSVARVLVFIAGPRWFAEVPRRGLLVC